MTNASFDAPLLELSLNLMPGNTFALIIVQSFDAPLLELSLNTMANNQKIVQATATLFRCSFIGAFFKCFLFLLTFPSTTPFRCSFIGAFFKFNKTTAYKSRG